MDVFPSYLKDFSNQTGHIQTGVSILTLPNEKTLPHIEQTVDGALCLSVVLKNLKQLDQGWPQFLCNGHKKVPKKLVGTKIFSKKAWRAKVDL